MCAEGARGHHRRQLFPHMQFLEPEQGEEKLQPWQLAGGPLVGHLSQDKKS